MQLLVLNVNIFCKFLQALIFGATCFYAMLCFSADRHHISFPKESGIGGGTDLLLVLGQKMLL